MSAARAEGPSQGSTARGVGLLVVAVLVGVLLLSRGFESGFLPSTSSAPGERPSESSDTTGGEGDGSTTTVAVASPTTRAPAEVRVQVFNGAGTSGLAGRASTAVAAAGFTTLEAGNAPATPTTVVYYVEGFEADAAAVATALGITAAPQPVPSPPPVQPAADAHVLVVLGADSPIQ